MERVGRSGVRGPCGRMYGSDLIRAASRLGRISGTGVDREIESSLSGSSDGVAERLIRLPHGVEDDGKLARHRDLRLLEAGAPWQSAGPRPSGKLEDRRKREPSS